MEQNPGLPFEQNGPRLPKAAPSYNRRRAGNACLVCRSRKTKCDNTRPVCGFCAATGGNCQYVDSDSSQLDRGTLAILQRLSQLESSLSKHVDDSLQQQTNFLSHNRVSQTSEQSPFQESSLLVAHEHASISGSPGIVPGERNAVDPNIIAPSTSYSKQQQNYIDDHSSENMPPSSEMLNASSEASLDSLLKWPIFSQAAPHLEPNFQVPSVERVEVIQGDGRTVPNNARKHGTTLLNLDHQVVNDLVDNFLINNHIKNPILDVDSLRNDVRAFTETGPGWDGKSCLILLVCAVSVLSAPLEQECEPGRSKDSERLSLANAYFEASQRRIGMLYHETSIVSAQCSFLTAVYLMSTLQILAAWKCFVQAGAQFLAWMKSNGRWRHTEDLSNPISDQENPWLQMSKVARERHVEDSLYWSCLKSEIEVRFELGMPGSGIGEMDYPHLFPSPPEDTEDQEMSPDNTSDMNWSSPKSIINSFDRQHLEKAWYFYLAEIALKRMLHNVIIRRFQSKARGRSTNESQFECNVREFDMQVEQWYQTLPALMSFSKQADVHTTDILRLILRGHMIDIKNFVRFPALLEVFVAQDPVSITELSPTHLRLVREALQSAADCIDSNRPSFFHRHQGTWLMARSCTRSALHLLAMALKCHFAGSAGGVHPADLERQFLPPRWKGLIKEMSMVLEYWSDENNDLARLSHIYNELIKVYEDSASIRLS